MNAIKFYRVANWLYEKKIPIIPKIFNGLIYIIFNSVVPYTAKIGAESKLAYGGIGVVIHSKSIIGNRVIIGQNVTIGRSLNPRDFPSIGNNVYISAGAKIIGNITVGNNVIIAANAVVNKDVPDNSIVAGVPAKIIKKVETDIYDLFENIF